MRGKVARALRKEIKYKQTSEEKRNREYQELEVIVRRQIYQVGQDAEGNIVSNLVWRDVPAFIVECVSGDRNIYQYLKKKYKNTNLVKEFNELPSVDELAELAHTVIKGEKNDSNSNDNGGNNV